MWPRQWWFSRSACLGLMLLLTQGVAAQDFQLRYDDGLLSVRATNTPFNTLLAALANETGIPFSTTGDSAPPVTIDIEEEPLAKAIGKLAPNHMLVRESSAKDAAIVEVVLILDDSSSGSGSGNDGGGNEFLPTGESSEEIIVSDPVQTDDGMNMANEPPVDPSMSQPPDDQTEPPPQ